MYDIIYNITGGGCWGGLEDEDSPCQRLLSVLQLCLLVWLAQGGASLDSCRSEWWVYCTFCFQPDHLSAAQANTFFQCYNFQWGNIHPTIQHSFKDDRASANTQRDQGNSSRLYGLVIWTWRFSRVSPQMMSITEAKRIRSKRVSESRIKAATRKQHSQEARSGAASGCPAWTDSIW